MRSLTAYLRTAGAALRILIVLTVILGIAYPLAVTAVAQIPGLSHRADGSTLTVNGKVVGSSMIGQSFTDGSGKPLAQYFQPRPSAAGQGYDPTASGASNLGPESIVDVLPDPAGADNGKLSLLSQVCSRSLAIGTFDGVDGSRPFCTSDGVGAVLAVFTTGPSYTGPVTRVVSVNQACPARPFIATYDGVAVTCATAGQNYSAGRIVPIRGDAPASPAVPADAVTSSGSGLDPNISPAYAAIQVSRVAKSRGASTSAVQALVEKYTTGRDLGFMGEPRVNVLELNIALDTSFPYHS
jgi:K+-transporting ATPase ATPase C chain